MKNILLITLALYPVTGLADHSLDGQIISSAEDIIEKIESNEYDRQTLVETVQILKALNESLSFNAGLMMSSPMQPVEKDSRTPIDLSAEVDPAAIAVGLTTGNNAPVWGLVPALPLNNRNFLTGARIEKDGVGLHVNCRPDEVVIGKGSGWTDRAPLLCGKIKPRFMIVNIRNIPTPWGYNKYFACPAGAVMVGWNITQFIRCGTIKLQQGIRQ